MMPKQKATRVIATSARGSHVSARAASTAGGGAFTRVRPRGGTTGCRTAAPLAGPAPEQGEPGHASASATAGSTPAPPATSWAKRLPRSS